MRSLTPLSRKQADVCIDLSSKKIEEERFEAKQQYSYKSRSCFPFQVLVANASGLFAVGFPFQSGLVWRLRSAAVTFLNQNFPLVLLTIFFWIRIVFATFAQNCPNADFEYNNTCFSQYTQFNSTSTQVEEGSFYQWDFDNDTNYDLITKQSTVYWEFPNTGVYTITLNLQTSDNCSSSTSNTKKYFVEINECENCVVKTTVPNSSFESTPECPNSKGLLSTTDKWFSANGGSPDLFSQCSQNEETTIPQNNLGNQTAPTGEAYAGIVAYSNSQTREYIGIELTEPLTADLQYFISFKVSLAESSAMAINELGAFFSLTEIIDPANTGRIGATPQFEYQKALKETEEWVTVNGNFKATEAFKFLTIGNFSENPTLHQTSGNQEQAYYYIDDVVVQTFFARVESGKTICPKETTELQADVSGLCEVFWTTESEANTPGSILSNELKLKVAPTESTSYIFNARNECCLFQDIVHIQVKEVQLPDAGPDAEICEGDPATLNVTGNGDFTWSPLTGIVDPFSSTTETYPIETTTYTLSTTDQQGCQTSDEVTITVLPSPKIEITNSVVFCQGEPIQILAYAGEDHTYQWSPVAGLSNTDVFNPIASPETTTQYTVNVINQVNNCTSVAYTTVEVKETVEYPTPEPYVICAGGSIKLLDVPEATSYTWSPQNNISCLDCANPTVSPAEDTNYVLDFVNANGCPGKVNYLVTTNEAITIFAGEDQTICKGQSLQLVANGVPENVAVLWKPSTGLDNPLSHTPMATPNENTLYTLQIIDESFAGCSKIDSINITVSGEGFADAGHDRVICAGDAILLKARGGIKYEWSPTIGLSSADVFNPVARPASTTIYSVKVTNRSGCTFIDEMVIEVEATTELSIAESAITLCDGESTTLQANGTGTFYNWTPAIGLSDTSIANPVFNGNESTTYTVTNFNNASDVCKATKKVEVNVFNASTINISEDTFICKGESTQLNATGGTSYSWTPTIGLSDGTIANPIATPDSTTTYEVTIFSESCFITMPVTVTIADGSAVNAGEDTTICLGDSHQLNATGAANYIWFPSTGLNDPTIANPIASPLETTTYRVSSGSNQNCSALDSITIFVNESSALQLSDTKNICIGEPTQLSVSGGSSYQWSPEESLNDPTIANPIATPLETTTYEVSVLNEDGACLAKGAVLIEVSSGTNTEVVAYAGEDFTICSGQDVQLSASGGTEYFWIPSTGLNDPTISSPLATLDTTTVFTVLVSNGNENECPARDEVEIVVEPGVDLVLDEGPFEICKGESIELKASGASRYSWTPEETLSNAAVANPVASPLENTVYVLTASNQRGSCKVVADVSINILDLNAPQVMVSEDQVICSNQSVQLNASGGNAYVWSPTEGLDNPNSSSPIASPDSTTIYQVTVSNHEGRCSSVAQVNIQVNEESNNIIDANAGEDLTLCSGQEAQLLATGGTDYSWYPLIGLDNPFIANPIATVDSTTTFTVTVNNGIEGSCPATHEITIFVEDDFPLTFTDGPFSICAGETVELFASGADNYRWEPTLGLNNANLSNPTATPAESITYTLTASNLNGCEVVKNVTVNVMPNLAIETIKDQTICEGDNLELMVSGGTTYQWYPTESLNNPTAENPIASPKTTTVYQVTALGNEENCPTTKEVIIGVIPPIALSTSEDQTICSGEVVRLNAFNVNGLDIAWSPAESLDNPLIAAPVATPEVSTTYIITANGGMNMGTACTAVDSIVVTVEESIIANAGLDQTICSSGIAQLEASGGTHYSWYPSTGLSNPDIANPIATLSTSLTYTVTVSNEMENCEQTDDVTIFIEENITANAGEDMTLCNGNEAQLMATGGTTYQWTPTEGLSDPNIANPVAQPSVTTTYSVLVSNGNEALCSDMDEVTITIEDGFDLVFDEGPYTLCEGESLQLMANGAGTYRWSPDESISNIFVGNPVVSPTESAMYTLRATNLDGTCAVEKNVIINVQPKIELLTETDYTICKGEMLQFNVAGASVYSWSPELYLNDPEIGNPMASPTEDISYTVTGSSEPCSASTTINVSVEESPELFIAEDQTICSGSSAQLSVSGNDAYSWSPIESLDDPSTANPIATPDMTTTYQVSSGNGTCVTTESVTVYVDNATIPRLCTQPVVTQFICPDEFCGIREGDVFTELDNTYFFCSLDINEQGCIEYTALPLFFGTDTISILTCDSINTNDCQTLTAIMSVVENCEAEICSNPVVSLPCVQSGETIELCPEFCLFDQLEGSGISDYSIINFSLNSGGTIGLNGNCFSYTSSESFAGPELIRLTACSTIYPDYCDEATYVLDVLNDCGLKVNPITSQQSRPQKEEANNLSYQNEKDFIDLNLYPIPAKNSLHLEWQNPETGNYLININTIDGQVLSSKKIYLKDGFQQQQIPIDYFAKGLYFISIEKDGIFMTEKFIKN